jgi:protein TonB
MFEDSLVESTGRIRTRSRRYAVGTMLLEAALLAALVLVPYLYPAALPQRLLSISLISPPPATPPGPAQAAAPAAQPLNLERELVAPSRIPTRIARFATNPPGPPGPITDIGPGKGNFASVPWLGPANPPPLPPVRLAKPSGPVRISSGVAAGQLLAPIRPQYPPIALAAHIQGTVVVVAAISAAGRIEDLRVVEGPPMLVSAAVDAIRKARYRPFLLNGQPVEVQTTISVRFTLDGQ